MTGSGKPRSSADSFILYSRSSCGSSHTDSFVTLLW